MGSRYWSMLAYLFLLFGCSAGDQLESILSVQDVGGHGSGSSPPEELPALVAPGSMPGGITGGHFDLDTSSRVYPFDGGQTDQHVHEYDDKYGVNGADFFALFDSRLGEIPELIPDRARKFILLVSNAELSPGAVIEINGNRMSALDYQKRARALLASGGVLPSYSLNATTGTTRLVSLKVSFSADVIVKSGLVPTATGCVRRNRRGARGEYRDGALLVQALDSATYRVDPATGAASQQGSGGLLWEATLFWHKDSQCY